MFYLGKVCEFHRLPIESVVFKSLNKVITFKVHKIYSYHFPKQNSNLKSFDSSQMGDDKEESIENNADYATNSTIGSENRHLFRLICLDD